MRADILHNMPMILAACYPHVSLSHRGRLDGRLKDDDSRRQAGAQDG